MLFSTALFSCKVALNEEDDINVLSVGQHFEILAEMSENSRGRHEIGYPISNFDMGLISLKFRPILRFQILAETDISFCFIFSLGFKPINLTRSYFIRN